MTIPLRKLWSSPVKSKRAYLAPLQEHASPTPIALEGSTLTFFDAAGRTTRTLELGVETAWIKLRDINGDGRPEILACQVRALAAYRLDGTSLWMYPVPHRVDDVDVLRVGESLYLLCGLSEFHVLDALGRLRWKDGDGALEVGLKVFIDAPPSITQNPVSGGAAETLRRSLPCLHSS